MAITKQIENAVALREQTWRVNFETPSSGQHSIQVYRENVPIDAEGNVVGQPQQSYAAVNRKFADVADETADVGGYAIAFADIVEALAVFGDRWAQEDADKPPEGPAGRRG